MNVWDEVWSYEVPSNALVQFGDGHLRTDVDGADLFRVVATNSTGERRLALIDEGHTDDHVDYGGPHNPPVQPIGPVLTGGRRLVLKVRRVAGADGVEADVRVPYRERVDARSWVDSAGMSSTDTRPPTDSEGRKDMREVVDLPEPEEPIRDELEEWWQQQKAEGLA